MDPLYCSSNTCVCSKLSMREVKNSGVIKRYCFCQPQNPAESFFPQRPCTTCQTVGVVGDSLSLGWDQQDHHQHVKANSSRQSPAVREHQRQVQLPIRGTPQQPRDFQSKGQTGSAWNLGKGELRENLTQLGWRDCT